MSHDIALARQEFQQAQAQRLKTQKVAAQVQESSGLPLGVVRVYRPDIRASDLVNGPRYRSSVWVFIEQMADDEWHITGVNTKLTIETFGVGYEAALVPSYDGEATNTLWGIGNLKPGKAIPSPDSPGTLKVWVLAFDHVGGRFETQEVDLSAYLPDASGEVLWAKIGVDTTTNLPVIDTSADYLYPFNGLMQVDDLNAIDLGSSVIALEGVTLRYGQTDIAQSRFESCRRILQPPFPTPALLLTYDAAVDLLNSAALTANVWLDVCPNQSFTVASPTDTIAISVSGNIQVGTTTQQASTRIVVDAAGTPITRIIGGGRIFGSDYINALSGAGTVYLTGLASGTHTIKVQVFSYANQTVFCRPASVSDTEFLRIYICKL